MTDDCGVIMRIGVHAHYWTNDYLAKLRLKPSSVRRRAQITATRPVVRACYRSVLRRVWLTAAVRYS